MKRNRDLDAEQHDTELMTKSADDEQSREKTEANHSPNTGTDGSCEDATFGRLAEILTAFDQSAQIIEKSGVLTMRIDLYERFIDTLQRALGVSFEALRRSRAMWLRHSPVYTTRPENPSTSSQEANRCKTAPNENDEAPPIELLLVNAENELLKSTVRTLQERLHQHRHDAQRAQECLVATARRHCEQYKILQDEIQRMRGALRETQSSLREMQLERDHLRKERDVLTTLLSRDLEAWRVPSLSTNSFPTAMKWEEGAVQACAAEPGCHSINTIHQREADSEDMKWQRRELERLTEVVREEMDHNDRLRKQLFSSRQHSVRSGAEEEFSRHQMKEENICFRRIITEQEHEIQRLEKSMVALRQYLPDTLLDTIQSYRRHHEETCDLLNERCRMLQRAHDEMEQMCRNALQQQQGQSNQMSSSHAEFNEENKKDPLNHNRLHRDVDATFDRSTIVSETLHAILETLQMLQHENITAPRSAHTASSLESNSIGTTTKIQAFWKETIQPQIGSLQSGMIAILETIPALVISLRDANSSAIELHRNETESLTLREVSVLKRAILRIVQHVQEVYMMWAGKALAASQAVQDVFEERDQLKSEKIELQHRVLGLEREMEDLATQLDTEWYRGDGVGRAQLLQELQSRCADLENELEEQKCIVTLLEQAATERQKDLDRLEQASAMERDLLQRTLREKEGCLAYSVALEEQIKRMAQSAASFCSYRSLQAEADTPTPTFESPPYDAPKSLHQLVNILQELKSHDPTVAALTPHNDSPHCSVAPEYSLPEGWKDVQERAEHLVTTIFTHIHHVWNVLGIHWPLPIPANGGTMEPTKPDSVVGTSVLSELCDDAGAFLSTVMKVVDASRRHFMRRGLPFDSSDAIHNRAQVVLEEDPEGVSSNNDLSVVDANQSEGLLERLVPIHSAESDDLLHHKEMHLVQTDPHQERVQMLESAMRSFYEIVWDFTTSLRGLESSFYRGREMALIDASNQRVVHTECMLESSRSIMDRLVGEREELKAQLQRVQESSAHEDTMVSKEAKATQGSDQRPESGAQQASTNVLLLQRAQKRLEKEITTLTESLEKEKQQHSATKADYLKILQENVKLKQTV